MSETYDDSNRQIIPRWYTFVTACKMGDIEPEKLRDHPKIESPSAFIKKIQDWKEKRTIPHAIDVIGSALIVGDYANLDVREASDFLLSAPDKVSSLGLQIAMYFNNRELSVPILEPNIKINTIQHRVNIARLKSLVRRYPRNAIAYADLAYHYILLGEKQKAEHFMNIAISIAGNNRFILRSAARCYLHLHMPEKSLYYLRRSELVNFDPWIISAEISISEGVDKKTQLAKKAGILMENTNLSLWSINELAGTMSTLEAKHGSMRKSKKLINRALQEPNENTMAQAIWLGHNIGIIDVGKQQCNIIAPFEAQARTYQFLKDYNSALQSAKDWFRFQPFTARPAVLASYIASTCLQDDQEAIRIIEEARESSLDSFLLRNNQAFSLASMNRLSEAEQIIREINESGLNDKERYTLLATKGLLKFRHGQSDQARPLYKQAISGFNKLKEFRSSAIATFFLAREEFLSHSSFEEQTLKRAIELAKTYKVDEIMDYAKILTKTS